MKPILVVCPLKITLPRKTKKDKVIILNMNNYRNLHYIINNQSKQMFKKYVADQLIGFKISKPVKITYTLHAESNRKIDVANVCCVIDKYFCDCLQELNVIKDDSSEFIPEVIYKMGSKGNRETARCEALIEEI